MQIKDTTGIRAEKALTRRASILFKAPLQHTEGPSWRTLGDMPWVTRRVSGHVLGLRPCLMSRAIGGLFEQTKGKYHKANWRQGENEEPMISEGDCRGNDKSSWVLKGSCYSKKGNFVQLFFFFFKWKKKR